jgi:hypothetical protein
LTIDNRKMGPRERQLREQREARYLENQKRMRELERAAPAPDAAKPKAKKPKRKK